VVVIFERTTSKKLTRKKKLMKTMQRSYVLLTAAKDEEAYIGDVINHVIHQTVRPRAWFIIDDGSLDRTTAIVTKFAADYPFIHLQSAAARQGRSFGSQYKAINAAYELARPLDFEFLGVVDADQAPESPTYYESLFADFDRNPKLGMTSGYIYERDGAGVWKVRPSNSRDSTAASALFRRTCYDEIGGYTPLSYGGSDALAQLEARRRGWEVATRPDLPILHYRPTSSAGGIWRGRFREGMMDGSFGTLPVFEILKCTRRLKSRPLLLGSFVRFGGYLWWRMTRKPLLSPDQVAFLRQIQRAKIRATASN
jgi:glycosyltransferase involved in cell wall biosynthesis